MTQQIIMAALTIWQFLQHSVASVFLWKKDVVHIVTDKWTNYCYCSDFKGMLPLGSYVFLNASQYRADKEKSLSRHSASVGGKMARLSRILGPLYVPVMIYFAVVNTKQDRQ